VDGFVDRKLATSVYTFEYYVDEGRKTASRVLMCLPVLIFVCVVCRSMLTAKKLFGCQCCARIDVKRVPLT
jgi:hypothetical protein